MILSSSISVIGDSDHVQVGLDETADALTPNERAAIQQFGEPVVACGGAFTGANALAFTLPALDLRFPSQFPVKHIFQREGDATSNAKAVAFRDTIQDRISAALYAKLQEAPGTTGRWINTVTPEA